MSGHPSSSTAAAPRAAGTTAGWRRQIVILMLLLGMAGIRLDAAPPPPRSGGQPYTPPVKTDTPAVTPQPEVQPFKPTPLNQLIKQHEKNQKLHAADVHKLSIDHMTRVLRDDYLAHGNRNEKWDKPLLKAIDEAIHCLDIEASVPQRKKLLHMLRLPARYKCDDPRYYYMFVYARSYATSHENLEALKKGIELARVKTEHHRYLIWLMELRLSQMQMRWNKDRSLAQAGRDRARQMFVQWLAHDPHDESMIYDWHKYFSALVNPIEASSAEETSIRNMLNQIRAIEKLPAWFAPLLESTAAMRWAWEVRGGDYAHTVKEDAWKVWHVKNEEAYQWAIKAHQLNPHQALAATNLIELCWSSDETQGPQYSSRYWLEQAIIAMIDWQKAYTKYAFGILPRWGGSLQMQMDFAWECALTKHYDTRIPYFACLVLHNIVRDQHDHEHPFDDALARQIFTVVQFVMKGYLEAEQDPDQRKILQQYWLNWTSLLNLPELAVRVNDQLDQPYDTTLPRDNQFNLTTLTPYSLNLLLARGKPGGSMLTYAIHAETYDKDLLTAQRLYQMIIKDPASNPQSIRYARDRIQHHQWQKKLDEGQWVSLQFDEHLAGWKQLSGQWERIDENTIQGTNEELPMRLTPFIYLGPYYEWQVTIHFIHKAKGPALMAGIVEAWENHPEHYKQYGQFVRQQPGSLWCHLGGYEPYRIGNHELPEKITCNFIRTGGRMKTLINGQELFKDSWMRGNNRYVLAMGTAFSRNPGSIIQYSDIRVRKLPRPEKEGKEDNQLAP